MLRLKNSEQYRLCGHVTPRWSSVRFWWSASQHLVMALRLLALVSWLSVAAHGRLVGVLTLTRRRSGQRWTGVLASAIMDVKVFLVISTGHRVQRIHTAVHCPF